ncbi:hypothetical protein PTSG_06885 [Salpingoeca rosetta]|uniref:Uncharacterized protein n=1 Tax=Salpingoeca rosetta (strain ATCC 50818 / BSB-021) TaxID=946362 RepID=F2UF31_SALR5|nr:uncharacterized protein PTSG_06885 [Salpingoeca rosetta]EGD75231.1 hypothetical protein PTSG_06885 [Salpingoeca rosetta]|eukprot:XP_004992284.1 hypothetical protein PTSG_06885 [Salpingoeca rosetta]
MGDESKKHSKKKQDKKKKKASSSSAGGGGGTSPKAKKKNKKKAPAKNPITIELERIRMLEKNPTLRWEHAKQDPAKEVERLKKYKEERRQRYREHRKKVVEAAKAQRGPTFSLRPPA